MPLINYAMSAQQHLPLVNIRPVEIKEVIAFSMAYRMLKEYTKVLVTLNEHSAHVQEKISTMEKRYSPESESAIPGGERGPAGL